MSVLMSTPQSPASDRTAGYQSWRKLAFLHWQVRPELIQPLLPASLQVETFDGKAWLGLVPFSMERVRPWWFVPVPGISYFPETNLRTYVQHTSGRTGVWFFSLEASSRVAVAAARTFWKLPYHHAKMSLTTEQGQSTRVRYSSNRSADPSIGCEVAVDLDRKQSCRIAERGTLEFFLLERYVLFAPSAAGDVREGRVHHSPYEYSTANVIQCRQTLSNAAGLDVALPLKPDHCVYSPGVDVRVSGLHVA